MNLLKRLFGISGPPARPALPLPHIGVTCRTLEPCDYDLLAALGVKHIRIYYTNNGDNTKLMEHLDLLVERGIVPMICISSQAMSPIHLEQICARYNTIIWQLDEYPEEIMTAVEYGASVLDWIKLVRQLNRNHYVVSAAFDTEVDPKYFTDALLAGMDQADAVCFSAVSPTQTPAAAFQEIQRYLEKAVAIPPLWITGFGKYKHITTGEEMREFLAAVGNTPIYTGALRAQHTAPRVGLVDHGLASWENHTCFPAFHDLRKHIATLNRSLHANRED